MLNQETYTNPALTHFFKGEDMITLTIEDFKKLLAADGWEHSFEHIDSNARLDREERVYNAITEEEDVYTFENIIGWVRVTSRLDDITITHTLTYTYSSEDPVGTFEINHDYMDDSQINAQVSGINVIDEDGDEVGPGGIIGCLYDFEEKFFEGAYKIEEEEPIEVDIIEDRENPELETITLKHTGGAPVRFTGQLISSAYYWHGSGYNQRSEFEVYKTAKGRFVCHYTEYDFNDEWYKTEVCETLEEVKDFFGDRELAQELYEELHEVLAQ